MSELTISDMCSPSNMSELCRDLMDALERKRAAAEPAKLKDPDWVSPSDRWPRPWEKTAA